jgi:hypothetical protein
MDYRKHLRALDKFLTILEHLEIMDTYTGFDIYDSIAQSANIYIGRYK